MDFTYNQTVNAQDFTTYDKVTGNEKNATEPMKMILAYYENGTALATGFGPLRFVLIGPEGLLTGVNYWVGMVTTIAVMNQS